MSNSLRLKTVVLVIVLLVFGTVGVYPLVASRMGITRPAWLIAKQLGLGLDLKGGVQIVLGVQIPDGTPASERTTIVKDVLETIERRVNDLGVAEPIIAIQGANGDQILVQLPGVANVERAKAVIGSVGRLELKIVEQGPAPSREALLVNGGASDQMDVVSGLGDRNGETADSDVYYLVRRAAAVSGPDLRSARPSLDENNRPAVSFRLNAEAGRQFGAATQANIGRLLAVVLDGRVQSVARIENRITTEGRIVGNFTQEEVQSLCVVLRSGSLSAPLTYLAEHTIGASLGADAIRAGVAASIAGLSLVMAFLVAYYRWAGVNAAAALLINLIIVLGLMSYVSAVMTLPGIAGLVLTMGMGVDSNVLIFERIKEELAAGRSVRASINAGFNRVFLTLLDTHVAALVAAAFLFQFGTGAIRGFAVTLSMGLASNLFTSTFASKTLFELALSRRQAPTLSI